jgi:hypothetical protein
LTVFTRALIGLKERRHFQERLARVAILGRTESELQHLVETLVEQERKFLTFLLGQIYSIHELLAFMPKGEEFLNFSSRKELQELDEEGNYPP